MIVLPLLFHSVSQQNAHQVQTPNRKAILIAVKGDPFVGLPEVFSPGSPRCSEAIFSQSFFIPLSVRKFSVKVQKAYSLHPCVILFTYLKSYHIQTDFVKECTQFFPFCASFPYSLAASTYAWIFSMGVPKHAGPPPSPSLYPHGLSDAFKTH